MKKYRLNTNKEPELSKEQIAKHKNFSALKANYDELTKFENRKPLYKQPTAIITLVIILLLTWFLMSVEDEEKKDTPTPSSIETAQ